MRRFLFKVIKEVTVKKVLLSRISLYLCIFLVAGSLSLAQGQQPAELRVQSRDSHAPDQVLPGGFIYPSIAVKPNNGNIVVAAMLDTLDGPCLAVRSDDGGQTWKAPVTLPMGSSRNFGCDAPVVRWSPDSSRLYAAYLDAAFVSDNDQRVLLVSSSSDNGKTWSNPVVAITGPYVISAWIDVHTFPSIGNANSRVYIFANISNSDQAGPPAQPGRIVFTVSFDHGASFRPQRVLALNHGALPRVIGGKDQDVLACWVDSEQIHCRTSSNFGQNFGPGFTAVKNRPFRGGSPYDGAGLSLAITPGGVAHIVFSGAPVQSSPPDYSDIFYVRSNRPYSGTSWSAPLRLNDRTDHQAQLKPTITAKRDPSHPPGHSLSVCWEDYRNSTPGNGLYDIYCDRTLPGWGPDIRISDTSYVPYEDSGSVNRVARTGPIDSSTSRVVGDRLIHVIWSAPVGFGVLTEKTLLP
jgi:hypothetical protein